MLSGGWIDASAAMRDAFLKFTVTAPCISDGDGMPPGGWMRVGG